MLWLLKSGITMLILNKDELEFVTEFPYLLGHPVYSIIKKIPLYSKTVDSSMEWICFIFE